MSGPSQQKKTYVRTIREPQSEPEEDEWSDFSPSERIEGVWLLTRLCLAWNNQLTNEPRLQRTITRIQRKLR